MEKDISNILSEICSSLIRKIMVRILRVGPIPNHIAFIMDGNRRYARKKKLEDGAGHDAGASTLMFMLMYCYELGVKDITAYAFSIDNFKRKPEEVQRLMDLMMLKIDLLTTMAKRLAVRVHFAGNLQLLSADIRDAANKLMEATVDCSKGVLTICVAYSSTDEILHAIRESCEEKCNDQIQEIISHHRGDDHNVIKLVDLEKHMYMAIASDPDIVIRTGGDNRLSNFLMWQSSCSHLSTMFVLWPQIGFWNLMWAVLSFQRNHSYFEKKKKQL